MEFRFTEKEEAFRKEVRDFLKDEPPEQFPYQLEDDGFGMGGWSYEFSRRLGEKGWLSLTWPKEYGGSERSFMERLILLEELSYHRAPTTANFFGDHMAHTIIELGSERVKKEILPKIAKGEATFWLALSEPNAGSDLLALSTQAVESEDFYVINGQKVWSSYANLADFGFLVARTDPKAPRHKGLSMFILDKKTPGVTVRPITSLVGHQVHNEIFFDDVRIPKDYLVGEKNQGFYQMLKGLEADRFWGRFVKPPACKKLLEELVEYTKETKHNGKVLAKDPVIRQKLAERAIEIEVCRLLFYRAGWMMSKGSPLTYEASVAKLFADEMGQRLYNTGMEILGLYSQLEEDSSNKWAPLKGQIGRLYLVSFGHTLAGGSSEIIRNTIATTGLGMPR